ncbi:hypothetical protein [Pseudomonas nunensis]|uniref:Serine endopeptidase inhibitors n=1 Tax=Pseudomonas nunensis TaxID=2961896 RepID=A0ABY5EAL7_9PSED|nr:hypothetical protein [Pseudomonas nunensis]KPN92215.1 hypothetical protein AL066_18440 [Pseudomonas nunensis]MCL5226997.1 hypothetical protein [Pseudomonas nunensis]UTO12434.1 hypothetical protein NK667_19940 [Pseudomonas nunensis]
MNTTCHQAKKPTQPKLKFSSFFSDEDFSDEQGTAEKADQPEMPTPGGDTTAHTGVLLTGGG